MTDIPPKLGTKTPADLIKDIPSTLPDPKLEKVDVPDIPDWKVDVGLNLAEKIREFFRALMPVVSKALTAISDVAKIMAFIQTFWIPIVAMVGIVILLFVLKVF